MAAVLGSASVSIDYGSFEFVLEHASRGDLFYFDPPYAPVSATANFTSYTACGFADNDQRRLRDVAVELAQRGCHVIVSNSTAPMIEELYERGRTARRAGLRTYRVDARRAINSNASLRGKVTEFIISNVTPTA